MLGVELETKVRMLVVVQALLLNCFRECAHVFPCMRFHLPSVGSGTASVGMIDGVSHKILGCFGFCESNEVVFVWWPFILWK